MLFSGTIRENLKWGNPNADDASLWRALEIAQAKEVVANKPGQLDYVLEQGGKNLSGGQRQRLTIARALVNNQIFLFWMIVPVHWILRPMRIYEKPCELYRAK